MFLRELYRKFYQFISPSISICAISYFGFHLIQGDRGLRAWQALEQNLKNLEANYTELNQNHHQLENKVRLLRADNLCPDLLEEQAKKTLGYIHPQEVMVMRTPQL